MKRKDLLRKLKEAGFHEVRDDGDRTIYKKEGFRAVQIPRHKEINEYTAKGILKAAGLK